MRRSVLYASNVLAGLIIGILLLGTAVYMATSLLYFCSRATYVRAAPIVDVSLEWVPKGRGSEKAFVPIVAVSTGNTSATMVKVETYDHEPSYRVGDRLDLRCRKSDPPICIPDDLIEIWLPSILTAVAGGAFGLTAVYFLRRPY